MNYHRLPIYYTVTFTCRKLNEEFDNDGQKNDSVKVAINLTFPIGQFINKGGQRSNGSI